jgi:serine protease Do
VAPAVVSINVIQLQAARDPAREFLERYGFIPNRRFVRPVQSMGSGIIVSRDGLIVTNEHVIAGAQQIAVTLSDGSQLPAVVVEEVAKFDLAFLKIEGGDLPAATFATVDDLRIGEWAIAIGSPFGYLLADTQPTVTVGVISALNRDIKKNRDDSTTYLGMIQTDAAINPGNSGGPLVNTRGEVIGINTFIFSESGGSVGIGFAVPADRVRSVLDEIERYGHYRDIDLGLVLVPLSRAVMRYLQTDDPAGVAVYDVRRESPAWKAGLRSEDILREMGGDRVTSLSDIERLIYNSNVGDRLTFTAERGAETWNGALILEERR